MSGLRILRKLIIKRRTEKLTRVVRNGISEVTMENLHKSLSIAYESRGR